MTLTPVKTPSSPSAATLTLRRPDDWHLHLRDGPGLAAVVGPYRPRLRTCNRHAKPEAAGHDGRRRARLPGPDPGRTAGRNRVRSADDAVPDGQHASGAGRGSQGFGHCPRRKVLPGRRDHQFGFRRHLARPCLPGSRGHGKEWRGPVAARRSHRARRRHVRPRTRLRGYAGDTHRARLPRSQGGSRTHHDERSGGIRAGSSAKHRRDDHAAAFAVLPQCAFRRQLSAAAPLLPAHTQARDAPASTDQGRHIGRSALLPRHGFGAPRETHEGKCLRMRRMLLGAGGVADVCRSLRRRGRARPPRRIREPLRRRLLWPPAARRYGDAGARSVDGPHRIRVR